MKRLYILLSVLSTGSLLTVNAQDRSSFDASFEPIKKELTQWDAVRGEWLATSVIAISNNQPIPDRTFPENVTPAQMFDFVPRETQDRITSISNQNNVVDTEQQQWNSVRDFFTRPNCTPTGGRSYGDPHLESFDGARYSFQTVGEFVLAKSNNGKVEVQARQKAQRDDFSLNTALAMNVAGDRVCLYAEDLPDGDQSTPLRVNGQSVTVQDRPYFLSNGGTVRKSGGKYIIDWPTGESVVAQITGSGGMSFMNVSTSVYPCTQGGYVGLLGNANGSARDDFNTGTGVSPIAMSGSSGTYIEKQHLAFLAREFAEEHRISMITSLFDYPLGTSTLTFTDRTFPRVHHSIDDLTPDQRNQARRNCESRGIDAADIDGCIYDNGFLNIPPSPRHVVEDPTRGTVLTPITGTTPNTNTVPYKERPATGTIFDAERPQVRQDDQPGSVSTGTSAPREKDPNLVKQDTKDNDVKPVNEEPTPRTPVFTPDPSPTPAPVFKPAPTPKPKPSPTPKPSNPAPTPRSSNPTIIKGR